MNQQINDFIQHLSSQDNDIQFNQVMELIDEYYLFTPTGFSNGDQRNEAGENSGSCKVFSFAQLHSLSEEQTLALFAQFYADVKATPDASDHQNIRQFMLNGFSGLSFDDHALRLKSTI